MGQRFLMVGLFIAVLMIIAGCTSPLSRATSSKAYPTSTIVYSTSTKAYPTSTGDASSCDCRYRTSAGTLMYQEPVHIFCLSGIYVSEKNPENSFTFQPNCKVTYKNEYGSKTYTYKTKAYFIEITGSGMSPSMPKMPEADAPLFVSGIIYRKIYRYIQ